MEIGAGLTNLKFLKKDLFENIKILLIDHNEWMISKCSRMKNILNLLNIQYSVLTCNTKYNNLDNDKRNLNSIKSKGFFLNFVCMVYN